jgi:hypothetical protein
LRLWPVSNNLARADSFGRHVEHVLPVGQETLGQRAAGAVAALDRPGPLGPGRHVSTRRGIAGLVGAEPPARQQPFSVVDDLDGRRQLVGIDPDEHPRHRQTPRLIGPAVGAGRALLLRAGQSLREPRPPRWTVGRRPEESHTRHGWAAAMESNPPTTWTECGRTPALPESSNSRVLSRLEHAAVAYLSGSRHPPTHPVRPRWGVR